MSRVSTKARDTDLPGHGRVVGGLSGVVVALIATRLDDPGIRTALTVAAPIFAVWLSIIGAGAEFVVRTAVRNFLHSWTSTAAEKNVQRVIDNPNSTEAVKAEARAALSKVQLTSLAHHERNVNQASKLSLPTPAKQRVKKTIQKHDAEEEGV